MQDIYQRIAVRQYWIPLVTSHASRRRCWGHLLICTSCSLPNLDHPITLLLPTLTLNFLLSHTLPNSLTNLHNFFSASATTAVSSANNSWFISNVPPFLYMFIIIVAFLIGRAKLLSNFYTGFEVCSLNGPQGQSHDVTLRLGVSVFL